MSHRDSNGDRIGMMSRGFSQRLSLMQDQKKVHDALLVSSDGQEVPVSKVVMAAVSTYFNALFLGPMGYDQEKPVQLQDITGSILQMIVRFAYSGELTGLTQDNLEAVVRAIDRLGMDDAFDQLKEACLKDLKEDNCLSYYRLAEAYYAPDVKDAAERVILLNFRSLPDMSKRNMTLDEMRWFISSDHLNVSREEQTYRLITGWIEADAEKRRKFFGELISHVRFGNAALTFVQELLTTNPMVLADVEVQEYLKSADAVLQDIQADPNPMKFDVVKYPFLRPRIPKDILFTFGGWSASSAVSMIETYDVRVNKWYTLHQKEKTGIRAYHGMVWFQEEIWIIGGFDGRIYFSTVESFDPVTKKWTRRACMETKRCYVSTAVLQDGIYACGGYDGNNRTETCEKYDPISKVWVPIASMNHQRSDASAAELNGKIYVVGGFDGNEVLQSAESYCPVTDNWTVIEMMISPRSGVQTVSLNGMLWVFGGNDGQTRQTSIERYDSNNHSWRVMGHMQIPRSNFAAVALEGMIYIIGGFNGNTTIDRVECFDPEKDVLTSQTMWKINQHRSALSACVVSGIRNGQEYTWLRKELMQKAEVKEVSTPSKCRKRNANQ